MSRSPLRGGWRRVRNGFGAVLVHFLRTFVGVLGWRGSQRLGAAMGRLAWHLAPRERRRAIEHLAIAFPELTDGERRDLARRCFRHLGMMLMETLQLLRLDRAGIEPHLEVEGWHHVEELQRQGRPILFLMAHCGTWEMLGAAAGCRGVSVTGIARQQDDPRASAIGVELRERWGNRTIARGAPGSSRELLKVLRGGDALAMLIDQDTRVDGVWVPFFGRLAWTPVGAAEIARRQGSAVVPAFDERREDGSHLLRILPALDLPVEPTAATAVMTAAIEQQIRRRPEQWVWMHRRWRRRPPEESQPPGPGQGT
jgi:KDO2-lipid IV(A) lauroyltransferase